MITTFLIGAACVSAVCVASAQFLNVKVDVPKAIEDRKEAQEKLELEKLKKRLDQLGK